MDILTQDAMTGFEQKEETVVTRIICDIAFAVIIIAITVLAFRNHFNQSRNAVLSENMTQELDWLQLQAQREYEAGELPYEEYVFIMQNRNE